MPVIDFSIDDYNFNPRQFIPLDYQTTFASSYHAKIDIIHNFHSTYSGSVDVQTRLTVEFDITGYDASAVTNGYPYAYVYLGEEGTRGIGFEAQGCICTNISGTFTRNPGSTVNITTPYYSSIEGLAYGSNFVTEVVECNLPLVLADSGDLYPDNLFSEVNNPSELNFLNYNPVNSLITTNILKAAINCMEEENDQEGLDFYIMNPYRQGTWNQFGETNPGVTAFRNIRGKIGEDGRIAFYDIPGIDGGALKVGVKVSGTISGIQYSENAINWTDSQTFPWSFFYRPRADEVGTFYYGLSFSNNIVPVFESEEKAEDYVNGTVSITEATNWGEISNHYEPQNETGEPSSQSDFGEVYTRGFFTQQYIMDSTCLSALANDLFDTSPGGLWESFKQGLDMFGENPMNSVMGLYYFPLALDSLFTTETASNVWFGGYGWPPSAGTAKRLLAPNGYKSLGNITFRRSFNSWRDFEPYTKLYVELPYCGTYQLDLARYYDKNVEVRYYFDTRSGACLCTLIADGHCTDYFSGQAGCSMPITLTDFSGFANSQIQTLLGGITSASIFAGGAAMAAPIVTKSVTEASSTVSAGLAGGVVAGGLIGAGSAIGAKTIYGLNSNAKSNYNKTVGGSSAMINQYLPQTVTFMFEIMEDCAPESYGNMFGYPSMKSGNVGNFTGFLKCQAVKVNAPIATASEKELLKSMLLSGIYI